MERHRASKFCVLLKWKIQPLAMFHLDSFNIVLEIIANTISQEKGDLDVLERRTRVSKYR